MNKDTTQKGFTVIESLLYIALFGIIIGGVTAAVYGIVQSAGRGQTRIEMQEEAGFLLGKLNWALTGACEVIIPASGVPAPSLSVTRKYAGTTCATLADPLVFALNSNSKLTLNGIELNSDAVRVISAVSCRLPDNTTTTAMFNDLPALNGKPQGVKICFNLQSLTPNGVTVDQTFETTKYLR
jgi:type II secretory pathway pseudopilin PulG